MDKISIDITGLMVCVCLFLVVFFVSHNIEYNEQYKTCTAKGGVLVEIMNQAPVCAKVEILK